jgi:hypothetical protein
MKKRFVTISLLFLATSSFINATSDIGNAIDKKEYTKMLDYIEKYNAKSKDIVETKKLDSGQVVDCIDFYAQPSMIGIDKATFKFPKPPKNLFIKESDTKNFSNTKKISGKEIFTVTCPKNTVGLKRLKIEDLSKYKTLKAYKTRFLKKGYKKDVQKADSDHRYAVIQTYSNNIGAVTTLNPWSLEHLPMYKMSLSQIWVMRGEGSLSNDRERLEAGVIKSHDLKSRLFLFYDTGAGEWGYYTGTGDNNGFTMVDPSGISIRTEDLPDYSIMGGHQAQLQIGFVRESTQGHWWLWVADRWVGFYNSNLWDPDGLKPYSNQIDFGGEVESMGLDMGSGRDPSEGWNYSAYQRNLHYLPLSGSFKRITGASVSPDDPDCYDVDYHDSGSETYFHFGGSGQGENCN